MIITSLWRCSVHETPSQADIVIFHFDSLAQVGLRYHSIYLFNIQYSGTRQIQHGIAIYLSLDLIPIRYRFFLVEKVLWFTRS